MGLLASRLEGLVDRLNEGLKNYELPGAVVMISLNVKLVMFEPESAALRRYLRLRTPLVSSALARAEVARALLPLGEQAVRRGQEVLARLQLDLRARVGRGRCPPSGITFNDRGTHTLKQLPGEWRLFAPDVAVANSSAP